MAWQAAVTLLLAVVAGLLAGHHGFVSSVLGGGIGVVGVGVFALLSGRSTDSSSGNVIRTALRAEAAKVVVIVLLLWVVFSTYDNMVVLAFIGAFVISVLLSGLTFAVSGNQLNSSRV